MSTGRALRSGARALNRSRCGFLDRYNKRYFKVAAVAVTLLVGGDVWAFREAVNRLEHQYSEVANREVQKFRQQSAQVLEREVGKRAAEITRHVSQLERKIADADAQLQTRLTLASQVAAKLQTFSGRFEEFEVEAAQIVKIKQDVVGQLGAVRTQVDGSSRELAEQKLSLQAQQKKLVDTGELVRALYSKPVTDTFHLKETPTRIAVIPHKTGNASVYFLLEEPPIEQTVQLQWHISVQPKFSYVIVRYGKEATNVIGFRWGQSAASLNQHPMTITYVGDPGAGKGKVFKSLSVKDDVVYADGNPLPPVF